MLLSDLLADQWKYTGKDYQLKNPYHWQMIAN